MRKVDTNSITAGFGQNPFSRPLLPHSSNGAHFTLKLILQKSKRLESIRQGQNGPQPLPLQPAFELLLSQNLFKERMFKRGAEAKRRAK